MIPILPVQVVSTASPDPTPPGSLAIWGAICFGLVVGWIANAAYTKSTAINLELLSAMIGVIGGGVVAMYGDINLFGAYCIGVAATFFYRMVATSF